jgi:8-oxo-dGTP pyrophosphatase MutT (NUDIX family)
LKKTLSDEKQPILTSSDVLDGLRPLAGGIILRGGVLARTEVLLVHHARKRGWGFPKGKLQRGETAREAALREVREETGLRCRCEALVGSVVYRSRRGRSRVATYWFMTPMRGGFRVSSEIDRIEWVSLDHAAARMARRPEAALLSGFAEVLAAEESIAG